MARGAANRNKVAKTDASPPKHAPQGRTSAAVEIESQLFFSRIRRRAKWVFVFLAVVFVGSFVLFGVGSGSTGLGDMLNGGSIFGGGNSSGRSSTPGIRKAQKLVAQNPKDPAAYRALSTAFQAAGKPDSAVAPLLKFSELRPKDSDALLELAALYGGTASRLTTSAQVQQQLPLVQGGSVFKPDSQTELGKALAANQIVDSAQTVLATKISDLYAKVNKAYADQVGVYKKLVALDPQDSSLLVQLANAQQQTGDTAGAVASYKSFLKISPDDPLVDAVKQQLKSLAPAPQVPAAGANGSG